MEEVIPLRSPIFIVFGDGTKVLFIQGDFDSFSFDFAERILRVLYLILFRLYFETIAKEILFIFEEVLQDYILILLQNAIVALYEGREES